MDQGDERLGLHRHRHRRAIVTFGNPIVSGEGALIRDAIRSPNYQPGVAGWSINEDGSAEFQSVVIGGQPEPDYVVASGGEALRRSAIRSGNFVTDQSGWRIADDGSVEFLNGKFRGILQSSAGDVGGCLLDAGGIRSKNYDPGVAGWKIGNTGSVEFGSGTFRGSARFVQPARRVKRRDTAFNIAAGIYFVDGLITTNYDADGTIGLTDNGACLQVPRAAIYSIAAGVRVRNDATGLVAAALHLRRGSGTSGPSTTGGILLASQATVMTGGSEWMINVSTPFLGFPTDKFWMVFESNGQFDLIGDQATFLAVAYSSEA
jgi:hypothetical protein